jgi:hypothetical protein
MPLSANLLRICQASHTEAWTFQGAGFGNMAYLEMSMTGALKDYLKRNNK